MAETAYLIDVATLADLAGRPDTRIVDCRFQLQDPFAGEKAYLLSHIPGAVYADLERDLSGPLGPATGRHPLPDPAVLASTFGRLGIGPDTNVVVYDEHNGTNAARAWWLLRWLGHDRACLLNGGFRAWEEARYPVEAGAIVAPHSEFVARPRHGLVLRTDEIIRAGNSVASLRLVDVRGAARFEGVFEPIDEVAGHIPGARNLPFTDNFSDDGHWLPVAQISARLARVIGEPAGQEWAVMCGSGVTACHLVIAGLMTGYSEPRLYVGSWSEWITDRERTVATGPETGGPEAANFAEDP